MAFLFNYFYADDSEQNIKVWDYTAGWFQYQTGLDNSTVILPDVIDRGWSRQASPNAGGVERFTVVMYSVSGYNRPSCFEG